MITKEWEKGKRTSLSFYWKKFSQKAKQFNRVFELPAYFAPMIGEKKDVHIADLGAGLFCTIGSTWPTATIRITASDLLADEFAMMLQKANITPVVPVEKQDMENLHYPYEMFDIVHCTNALDHCVNPVTALNEMYRVCKPGGWIYLRHYAHVGEHQNYCGLHMWNIDLHDTNDCKIWNKKTLFTLHSFFPSFKTVLKKEMPYEPDNMVVSTLHKI